MELSVTLGILAGCGLIFLFLAERLNVFGDVHDAAQAAPPLMGYHPLSAGDLSPPSLHAPRLYSMVAITAATLAVAFLPEPALMGSRPERTPVFPSRTVEGLVVPGTTGGGPALKLQESGRTGPPGSRQGPLLVIDGNRDGNLVLFDHEGHAERLAPGGEWGKGKDSCALCHHLSMPLDQNSSCFECHRDMYERTNLFNHAYHVRNLEGNAGCGNCHVGRGGAKTMETAAACTECHADLAAPESVVDAPGERWREAASYRDALHGLCIACHEEMAREKPEAFPARLSRCEGCHDADSGRDLQLRVPGIKKRMDRQEISRSK